MMPWFNWVDGVNNLRLDIVGIVAVLGEGCTARIIDASSLSWHHVLPRLLPAPQALLRHQQVSRLPTEEGMVIGVYSGNYNPRLNHFCRLLHSEPLQRNMVELVEVSRPALGDPATASAFGVGGFDHIAKLSVLGTLLALGILLLAIFRRDGFAMVATILLALTSTIVGYASKWKLELDITGPQPDRKGDIPTSDLVIFYPTGAFRVIKCSEEIARLYFTSEVCRPYVDDDTYRFLALLASVFLMVGLLCMGNCSTILQLVFAAAYIFLNICYWGVSALNPMKYHWSHEYKVDIIQYHEPEKAHPRPTIMHQTPGARPKMIHDQSVHHKSHLHGIPTQLAYAFTSKSDHVSDQPVATGNVTHTEDVIEMMPTARLRRKQGTDLEGNKIRELPAIKPVERASSAPIQRSFSGFFWLKALPVENKESRRFTQALWITIALTGSGRWLKNTRIAPDTDVWHKWIDLAEKRSRSKRNERGELVPPGTMVDGKISLPAWNYDGTLKALLQKEREDKKNRPPDPPTLSEILWGGTTFIPISVRIRLRRWATGAKSRLETGDILPFPGVSDLARQSTK